MHWGRGGGRGNGGTFLISSGQCYFGIYLDIQATTTLLCLLLILYVLLPSIHSIFYVTTALLKSDVLRTQKPKAPRVLDLQGWN